jgi:hypothetical protein
VSVERVNQPPSCTVVVMLTFERPVQVTGIVQTYTAGDARSATELRMQPPMERSA